jgi:hypothetical protein
MFRSASRASHVVGCLSPHAAPLTELLTGRAVPRAQYKRVKEYMADPRFTVRELRAVSLAGSGLLKWVLAMVNYFAVAKGVEPKRRKVADAELSLRAAQKELAKIKARPALHAMALAFQMRITAIPARHCSRTWIYC